MPPAGQWCSCSEDKTPDLITRAATWAFCHNLFLSRIDCDRGMCETGRLPYVSPGTALPPESDPS